MENQFQQLEIISTSSSTRLATVQDLNQLASLTSKGKDWARTLSDQLQDGNTCIIVADQNDQLVGFIQLRIARRGVDAVDTHLKRLVKRRLGIYANESDALMQTVKYGHIQEIYLKPVFNESGIKKALIEACIEWSRSQQVSELYVEIDPNEEARVSSYRSLGFSESSYMISRRLPKRLPHPKQYIRFANQDDLPQLIDLVKNQLTYQQSLTKSFELLPEANWSHYISSILENRNSELFVADQKDQLVGYFETRIYHRGVYGIKSYFRSLLRRIVLLNKKKPESFGVMEHIFVIPEFRTRGIAQNLVLGGTNWFRNKGVEEIIGIIWANNESTINLTRTIGFKTIKVTLNKRI